MLLFTVISIFRNRHSHIIIYFDRILLIIPTEEGGGKGRRVRAASACLSFDKRLHSRSRPTSTGVSSVDGGDRKQKQLLLGRVAFSIHSNSPSLIFSLSLCVISRSLFFFFCFGCCCYKNRRSTAHAPASTRQLIRGDHPKNGQKRCYTHNRQFVTTFIHQWTKRGNNKRPFDHVAFV